jgi:hypothetical protein
MISKTSQVLARERHFGELYFVAQKVMKQLETLLDAEVEHYLNATFDYWFETYIQMQRRFRRLVKVA